MAWSPCEVAKSAPSALEATAMVHRTSGGRLHARSVTCSMQQGTGASTEVSPAASPAPRAGRARQLQLEEGAQLSSRATRCAFGAYIPVHDDVLLQMLLQAARGTLPLSAE